MRNRKQSAASAPDRGASPRRSAMTERDLMALIEERESYASKASSYESSQADALSYYLGMPLGNEVEDRSQVVMREVYGVIEWIKPALLRIFFGGDQVVKFTPKGPEDVQRAEQETDVVQHVATSQNDGFATFYAWFTDALLMRNGYVVAYWDERDETTESSYRGLSLEEATMLIADKQVEVLESDEHVNEATGEPAFDIKLRQKDKIGRVMFDVVPPERVLVEAGYKHVNLSRANFVEYWEDKTISQLREEGFDVPDTLADSDDEGVMSTSKSRGVIDAVRHARDSNQYDVEFDDDPDPASRKVKVRTIFMRVDYDRDGIAEMRRIVAVGRSVLANEPYDRVLMAALTPTIMPHRHVGLSVADAVMDLQAIKSTLVRGMLDNMYLANNGRFAINEDTVNLDDFLTTRPGGVVRVAGDPVSAIAPLTHPVLGGQVLQTIEYLDNVLENRTGASPRVLQGQSFDGNAINKTATGINAVMGAAMARIELIARVFAETGVRDLFLIIHSLLLKHGRKSMTLQLRNQFVAVDPREWQKRTDMTIEVGLGTGDKQAKIAMLQMLITAQQGLSAVGLSNPQTMYNALSKLIIEMGYKNPEEFFVNPGKPGYQPPQPQQDPKLLAEQAKISLEQQKAQADAQYKMLGLRVDVQKTQTQAHLEAAKAFMDAQVKVATSMMQQDAAEGAAGRQESLETARMDREDARAKADRGAKLAEIGVNERGQPAKPRRRVFTHHRGPDGRIAASEMIEVDDPEPESKEN